MELTVRGFSLLAMKYSSPMRSHPTTNPITGELNMGMITLYSKPHQAYQGLSAAGADQITTFQLVWADANVAPINPPMSA